MTNYSLEAGEVLKRRARERKPRLASFALFMVLITAAALSVLLTLRLWSLLSQHTPREERGLPAKGDPPAREAGAGFLAAVSRIGEEIETLQSTLSTLHNETKSVTDALNRPRADLNGALDRLLADVRAAHEASTRRARPNAYLGDNVLMCHVAYFDTYFFLEARDRGVTPRLCQGDTWEEGISGAVRALLRPGQTIVDVGAGVGWHTALFARAVGPTGRVLAVEANPRLAQLLARSMEPWYPGVKVVNKAVGNETGEKIWVANDMEWVSGLKIGAAADGLVVRVDYARLDTVLRDEQWARARVDVIRIDVEGHEWQVWEGMQETLAVNLDLELFLVINVRRDKENGVDSERFFGELQRRFQSMFVISDLDSMVTRTSPSELLKSTGNVLLYLNNQPP